MNRMLTFRAVVAFLFVGCLTGPLLCPAGEVKLETKKDRVSVYVDGELFTEYIFQGYEKPILYPIIGPDGIRMTRDYPMKEGDPSEAKDHPHHKSIWFGHMETGGESFWHSGETAGTTVQTELSVEGNTIRTKDDFIARDGKTLTATDSREISFFANGDTRSIDFSVTYHANVRDIVFGDNKDGQMGIRMNPQLRIKGPVAKGQATNSEGVKTKDIWGKRAKWIDYWGPVDGKTVGIAVFDHPSNLRHPTWWHARDYGLLSANPFGRQDFEGDQAESGDHKLAKGESLTFKHRFVFHRGDPEQAKIEQLYEAWAK
ncbi:MAG: PmoA family protein [Planctomycetales bacterium]|nr:PmoA family protein [Planctomycetales bacterium]